MSLGETCLLPRRYPAWRWREPDFGFCMERENLCLDAKGDIRADEPVRIRVPMRGIGADCLVVVMKPSNAGGAKEADYPDLVADQPQGGRSR